jgi:predicted RNA-binding Zn-ribbon protein involved in translation (DUF1610 family)
MTNSNKSQKETDLTKMKCKDCKVVMNDIRMTSRCAGMDYRCPKCNKIYTLTLT